MVSELLVGLSIDAIAVIAIRFPISMWGPDAEGWKWWTLRLGRNDVESMEAGI